jgi:quercetin dioxygenase-like cupin family protein
MKPIVLTAADELALGPAAERFIGADYDTSVSFFINHTPPGHVTGPHRHPYAEVFVVHTGELTFTVSGEDVAARGGQVVVVPAGEVHGFRNAGPETVEMVSIHPAAEMETEWL